MTDQFLNQIRHLSFTAPDQLRERLKGVSRQQLAARAAALRPSQREGADPVLMATKTALRILGRRVLALDGALTCYALAVQDTVQALREQR